MSESTSALGANGGDISDNESSPESDLECSICLSPAVHPVKLPCSHIFCFLCVKGSANRSKRCALCRQVIPPHFLFKPTLMKTEDLSRDTSFDDGYQWYYEGNRGWWQYDERTSSELEAQYKAETEKLEVLIAGFLYVVDFENMIQYRRNDPSRRRRIKRDSSSIPIKGVAGLKIRSSEALAGNRREGDGGFEVDTNQNLPTSSSNTPSRVQTQPPGMVGNVPSSARSPPGSHRDGESNDVENSLSVNREETQTSDRMPLSPPDGQFDQSATQGVLNSVSSASASGNAEAARTDINSNRGGDLVMMGDIYDGGVEGSPVQNSGQPRMAKNNEPDSSTQSINLQENHGGVELATDTIHSSRTESEEVESMAINVRNMSLSEQSVDSPQRNTEQHRMQLRPRTRSGRPAKRQKSPNS